MTTGFDLIASGKLIEGAFYPFVSLMGIWFWFFLMFIPIIMIYLKTENFAATVLTFLLLYPIAVPNFLPQEVHIYVTPLVYIAGAIIMWRLFKSRGSS